MVDKVVLGETEDSNGNTQNSGVKGLNCAIGWSRPSLFRSKLVKNTGSLVFLSLWILNKNTTKGFRKIISGIDQPRLVFFFSCDFSCTFAKFVCKNW